jgi:hypothetical protein
MTESCRGPSTTTFPVVLPNRDSGTRSQHCSKSPSFLQLDVYPTTGTAEATVPPETLNRLIAKYRQSHKGRAGLPKVKPTLKPSAAKQQPKGQAHGTNSAPTSSSKDSDRTQAKGTQSVKRTSREPTLHSKIADKGKSS